MILIVCDSGSTKADWLVAVNGLITEEFSTQGFNPFFHSAEKVFTTLTACEKARKYQKEKCRIYFFGAGCSSPARNAIIHQGLQQFFTESEIVVEHDLLGAALATCGRKPGLVCILGTGSNIAFFDGHHLSETRHGLGYILGDEASGSYFGKKLITAFLYRIMPEDLSPHFFSRYAITRESAIERVYHQPDANVFLASVAPFLSEHKNHPWICKLVQDGFILFFETHIKSYPEYRIHPVHFIGSIAFHFRDLLHQVAVQCGFQTGSILTRPVGHIMQYLLSIDSSSSS
jgi:prepilin-type processing-associated H-X9-DG protein